MAKNRIPAALITQAAKLKYPAEFRAPMVAPLVRNKPEVLGPLDTLPKAEEREEARLKHEWLSKLAMLFRHYGVPVHRDNAYELLVDVLIDWVPGFTVIDASEPAGRPPTPDEEALAIYEQIEGLRLKLKSSRKELKSACEVYKKATGDKRAVRTLENIFRRGEAIVQSRKANASLFPSALGLTLPGAEPSNEVPRKRTKTRSKSAE